MVSTASKPYLESGAEAAGLLEGDVILRFQDEEVGTMNRLNTMLVAYRPGDQVELLVLRNGGEQTFRVTLTDGTAAQ